MQQVVIVEDSVDKKDIHRNMAALPGYVRISGRGFAPVKGVIDNHGTL